MLAFSVMFLVTPSHSLPPANTNHEHAELGSPVFWWKMLVSFFLILLGGIFAGLTLGLMGLDELHLRVLAMSSDNEEEKRNATKGILHHHLSLVHRSKQGYTTSLFLVLRLMKKGRHWVLVVCFSSSCPGLDLILLRELVPFAVECRECSRQTALFLHSRCTLSGRQ